MRELILGVAAALVIAGGVALVSVGLDLSAADTYRSADVRL
jgi:hypothetical protein